MRLLPTKAKAAKHPCLAAPTKRPETPTGTADSRRMPSRVKFRAWLTKVTARLPWWTADTAVVSIAYLAGSASSIWFMAMFGLGGGHV